MTLQNTFDNGLADGTLLTVANSDDGGAGDALTYVDEDVFVEAGMIRIHCPSTIDDVITRRVGWDVEDGGSPILDVSIRYEIPSEILSDEAPASVLFTDNFTRTNDPSGLGSPWTGQVGTFGVQSNHAYLAEPGNGGGSPTPNGVLNEMPTDIPKFRATFWASTGSGRQGGRITASVAVDGKVYVGGCFDRAEQIGGTTEFTRIFMARFDQATGELDESWTLDLAPTGLDGGYVRAMELSADESLIFVAGDFTTADGSTRNHIFAIDVATGALHASYFSGFACNGAINALVVDGNDLYVAGAFTSIGGQSRNRAAKLDVTDNSVTVDGTWNPNCGAAVASMHLCDNGTKRLSLNLDPQGSVGGSGTHSIAMVNATTGAKVWGANPTAGGGYVSAANPDWGANGILVLGTAGSGGNKVFYLDFNAGTQILSQVGNGDIQGLFFHRNLLYVCHHDDRFMPHPDTAFDSGTAQVAVGMAVLGEDGELQAAPWRSRFEQNGSDPYGGGVLKTWGGRGFVFADQAFILVYGDHTKNRNAAGTVTASPPPRRLSKFDEGLTPGAGGASSNVWTMDPGLSDYTVEADLTLSPTTQRVNAGVVARLTGPNDYLFAKIEVTAAHNEFALLKNEGGTGSTVLATGSFGAFDEGEVYHVSLQVDGSEVTAIASQGGVVLDTIVHTLSLGDQAAFTGRGAGIRIRYVSDEDDGQSTFDSLVVSEVGAGDTPSNVGPAPAAPLLTAYDERWRMLWAVLRDSGGQIAVLDRRRRELDTSDVTIPRDFLSRIDVHAEIGATAVADNQLRVKIFSAPSAQNPSETLTLDGLATGSPGRDIAHILLGPTFPNAQALDVLVDQANIGAAASTTISAENLTHDDSGVNNAGGVPYTSAVVSADPNKILLLYVGATALGAEPSTAAIAGVASGWSLLDAHYWRSPSGSVNRFKTFVYAVETGSSPTDEAITITFPGAIEGCEWSLEQIDGSPGTTVAEAIGQITHSTPNTSGTSGSITVPSLSDPSNALIACFQHLANELVTPDATAGWAELSDDSHSGPNVGMMVEFLLGEDTDVEASWATSAYWGGIVIELLASSDVVVPTGLMRWASLPPDCGGGYQAIAECPVHPGYTTAASDVGGLRLRKGFGTPFLQHNRGLFDAETYRKVASVVTVENAANPGHCKTMAAFGQNGNAGVAISYDHGDWENVGDISVNFNMHNGGPAIVDKPRTLGPQLAYDPTHDCWYLASHGDGIYRTSDDGHTATLIAGGSGLYPRWIAYDVTSGNLFVGVYQTSQFTGGLHRISTPETGTGKTMTRYTTGAKTIRNVESIDFNGSTVYCVGTPTGTAGASPGTLNGDAGIFRGPTTGTATLTDVTTNAGITGANWPLSIAVQEESGGQIVCVVGIDEPSILSGSRYRSLVRSTNMEASAGSVTWTGIGLAADVTDTTHPGNDTFGNQRLGRKNCAPCQLIPSQQSSGVNSRRWSLLVAEGGIFYTSTDGGRTWRQDTAGMTIWSNNSVTIDRVRIGWLYGGNQDNDPWYSPGDHGDTIITRAKVSGAVGSNVTTGHDQDVDPLGQVWAVDNNANSGNGVGNLGRGTPLGSTLDLVLALSGSQQIAIKTGRASSGSGTIRKAEYRNGDGFFWTDDAQGDGGWAKTTGTPTVLLSDTLANTPNVPLRWPERDTSPYVFGLIRGSASASAGIWRSSDRMVSIERLIQDTSMTGARQGFLAVFDPDTLYYSNGDNLYRVRGATGSNPQRDLIAGVANAGPLCFDDDGNLAVYCTPAPGVFPKVLYCENPPASGALTFVDLADPIDGQAENDIAQQLLQVNDIQMDADRIFLVINGGSMVRGIRL